MRLNTPKVDSQQSSQKNLSDLVDNKDYDTHDNFRKSLMQHSKLIKFTEKAAGVVSERNRKFQKPQTLKNLEQKLLQEDDD